RFFSIRDTCPGLLPDPAVGTAQDGSASFSMVLRRGELERGVHKEITDFGGWRPYLKSLGREH
ncbi:gamma-glutamylcyclotransferase, partial [Streptomyces albiflaviniger]|nr:gamma-glutamylcyclotransferase [Streptomyces albiflaviniger]